MQTLLIFNYLASTKLSGAKDGSKFQWSERSKYQSSSNIHSILNRFHHQTKNNQILVRWKKLQVMNDCGEVVSKADHRLWCRGFESLSQVMKMTQINEKIYLERSTIIKTNAQSTLFQIIGRWRRWTRRHGTSWRTRRWRRRRLPRLPEDGRDQVGETMLETDSKLSWVGKG